jgi:hypothetical protein
LSLVTFQFHYWFTKWVDANNYLRKDFNLIIKTYAECSFQYRDTIKTLMARYDYQQVAEFLEVPDTYLVYLNGVNKGK